MNAEPSLDDLRREIDGIDEQIHRLLMDRAAVSEKVRDTKRAGPNSASFRPGREAQILRRLVATHDGPFPRNSLIRIWREILATSTGQQGPFSVGVLGESPDRGFAGLARDHFGSYTPMTVLQSPRRVLDQVLQQVVNVGILPVPRQDDEDPWWPNLAREDPTAPRIVARLPFAGPANLRDRDLEALVISPARPEPSDEDRSQLIIDTVEPVSMARLGPAFEAAELKLTFASRWQNPQVNGSVLHLVEVDGFVPADDARMVRVLDKLAVEINRVIMAGAYAVPLRAQDLTPPAGQGQRP